MIPKRLSRETIQIHVEKRTRSNLRLCGSEIKPPNNYFLSGKNAILDWDWDSALHWKSMQSLQHLHPLYPTHVFLVRIVAPCLVPPMIACVAVMTPQWHMSPWLRLHSKVAPMIACTFYDGS